MEAGSATQHGLDIPSRFGEGVVRYEAGAISRGPYMADFGSFARQKAFGEPLRKRRDYLCFRKKAMAAMGRTIWKGQVGSRETS